VIEKLKAMLRRHEGLRLVPYFCSANHHTVGYGHNLDAHHEPIPYEISYEQAEAYLDTDIKDAIRDCAISIPIFSHLDPMRQAVLVDLAFNMGIGSLLGFKKMLAHIGFGEWVLAGVELLDSKYAKQVKGRADELAAMLVTGQWQENQPEPAIAT
jgi:lysozyme